MLKDVLTKDLDVVFCGTAKGKTSALKGYYYAGSGNKFYSALHLAGFTTTKLEPRDCYDIGKYNIGLTDLVHNECGNDNELSSENYDVEGFIAKMKEFQPKFIAFNGKTAASFFLGYQGVTSIINYGLQDKTIEKSKLFVLPSTSGSSRRYWDDRYWLELKKMIDEETCIGGSEEHSART